MEKNIKAIALDYANKIWNEKEVTSIDKLVDQDVVIHSALGDFHGVSAMKKVVQAWLRGFPDLTITNDLVISENDLVSIQWRAKGTHKGEFKGQAATEKTVSYSGVTVYRIKGSKITEYWAYLDMQHLLSQI